VAVVGDGSAMYSVQALWSAANKKLPVVFVLCNNGGYRIIKQRLKLFHGNDKFIGMDFRDPSIDAVGLARGFGLEAHRVEDAASFDGRLAEALAASGPTLLEVVVDGTV
jgi:benzoylformate decarboxylase